MRPPVRGSPIPNATNVITEKIVDASIKVHSRLGPGLLESAYQRCLAYELEKRGLPVESQVELPLTSDEIELDAAYRLDLWSGREVVVEIKSATELAPIHLAQMLTYLKLSGSRVGLLLNFNTRLMKDGIKRVVL